VQISSPPSAASATASKAEAREAEPVGNAPAVPPAPVPTEPGRKPRTPGSISRRLLILAAVWILALLSIGGFALDRIVTGTITRNFDTQLAAVLPPMIAAAELDPYGEVRFNRPPVEPRFNEPYSGLYWQVASEGRLPFRSRSLWDRELPVDMAVSCIEPCSLRSDTFRNEPLRIVARDGIIPGSPVVWRFQVAQNTEILDAQIRSVRSTLWWSLGALGAGLFALAVVQATVGLMPLRRMSDAMAAIREGRTSRAPIEDVPPEIAPLVNELNALLDHNEQTAESARMHAGNLAHALKTPMSVLMNEAAAESPDLARAVVRELSTMRRHIDHHLARARAMGRRTAATARADVWPALERLISAIERIYAERGVVIDLAGDKTAVFRGERQDLEEMAGNLIDNAAKYGGGRVFVTVSRGEGANAGFLSIAVEDDGQGIPLKLREGLFERGARLDTGKPGTGLGLAIVRDVAGIYGGSVALATSEDLGGLLATLKLPACEEARKTGADARKPG
jgi:signal transduction histidine kinase